MTSFGANFAGETTQTFVAWQFNTQIWHRTLPFSLFDAAFTPSQLIEIHPAVSRRIIFEQLDKVDYAIRALRTQSIFNTAITYTAHCWLDFNRTLEIAYTTQRLSRCRATEQDNGAVYMESILRNVDWIKWRDSYGPGFQIAYGLALKETRNGEAWLATTSAALAVTSFDDEVAYWQTHGITRYTICWQNRWDSGIDDRIWIKNALQKLSFPIKHVAATSQIYLWTSNTGFHGVYNTFNYALNANVSLLFRTSKWYVTTPGAMTPEQYQGNYPSSLSSIMLHETVGPLNGN